MQLCWELSIAHTQLLALLKDDAQIEESQQFESGYVPPKQILWEVSKTIALEMRTRESLASLDSSQLWRWRARAGWAGGTNR